MWEYDVAGRSRLAPLISQYLEPPLVAFLREEVSAILFYRCGFDNIQHKLDRCICRDRTGKVRLVLHELLTGDGELLLLFFGDC